MSDEARIELVEQADRVVELADSDAEFLSELRFAVIPCAGAEGDRRLFTVNPQQWVGHFRLPSGVVVAIAPKIPSASVLRMLAYAFLRWNDQILLADDVEYETDSFLFEPLVKLFNELVTARTRRGLVQDYVRHEENLASVRGKVLLREHLQQNAGYPNRAYCRFFENTADIPDNQVIRCTLRLLLSNGLWTKSAEHDLISNLHQFESVTDVPSRSLHFGMHHYHRLNEDYEPIHRLCALFLATGSIAESVGNVSFKGFLLDMNRLFEKFVEQAFITVGRRLGLEIKTQQPEPLGDGEFVPMIQPDIMVSRLGVVTGVFDAKYKRDAFGPQNSDIFQVIAYGTALRCFETYLFYPETELGLDRTIYVKHSPIVVRTRRVAVFGKNCLQSAEHSVREVLLGIHQMGARAGLAAIGTTARATPSVAPQFLPP